MKPEGTPQLFKYHDYREFLRDWISHRRNAQGDTAAAIAQRAKLTPAYLSMVLQGKRPFTRSAIKKLLPHLGLPEAHWDFLLALWQLADGRTPASRTAALKRIQKSLTYRQENPSEFEVFQFLSHPLYPVLREIAGVQGFRADARWIQKKCRQKASPKEIEAALQFLVKHGFLLEKDGKIQYPEKPLRCADRVFRLASAEYHRLLHEQAVRAIYDLPHEEKKMRAQTIGVSRETFEKVKDRIDAFMDEIFALTTAESKRESVYHIQLNAFLATEPGE
ncbi:MAG: TIGR02147 family protein [Bacteriovoracia bacterium]